ncbi:MAG: hypothetical protein IJ916_11810 [Paludibacteraceae bacterium]|nr:hypothetical protein [Paludibacteraceae bacterium]
MKKYLFFLLLISFCSCGGKQDNVDVTKEDTITVDLIDSVAEQVASEVLLSEREESSAKMTSSVPVGDYKVDYDSYPSKTPKSVFLIDEFHGKYGPTSLQPLDAALNAFDKLPEFTDSTIAEIEQFYDNLDESGNTGDMVLAANVRCNLAFYKTIREYSEIVELKDAQSIHELIAAEYAKWNLLADKVCRIGIDIVNLTYFQGTMSGTVSSGLEASIQEIGFYDVNVLKCRLIRDSYHLKEGIPEKIAAEALCKTIDMNLKQLNRPDLYEGEARTEYENLLKNTESDRKGLEELIEEWLAIRYAISEKVDGDLYRPYIGSTGVLLINMAAEINM